MQPSTFNVRVPVPGRDEVFLMNTLSQARLLVSSDVARLLDELPPTAPTDSVSLPDDVQEAVRTLFEHGFIVHSREAERTAIEQYFTDVREDTSELRLTILTTLQCNFACEYCYQGEHAGPAVHGQKMSADTSARLVSWVAERLDAIKPQRLSITFFGGEPLLNPAAMFAVAEGLWAATRARGVEQLINVVTNGLLITPSLVHRLKASGLNGMKITLDGDRDTHDALRPLRGGQRSFDRIIENLKSVAGLCRLSIGGNFDMASAESYPALLDFLKDEHLAEHIARVNFKPIIRPTPEKPSLTKGITLKAVDPSAPLGGACASAAGAGTGATSTPCDSCHFIDDKMDWLRREAKARGYHTPDGTHAGPCDIHRRHSYTIGPDGSIYACPGFTGDLGQAVGHIDRPAEPVHVHNAKRFEYVENWRSCGDCAFIPACAGGCATASHVELGDMTAPTCHKASLLSATTALAYETAGITLS